MEESDTLGKILVRSYKLREAHAKLQARHAVILKMIDSETTPTIKGRKKLAAMIAKIQIDMDAHEIQTREFIRDVAAEQDRRRSSDERP